MASKKTARKSSKLKGKNLGKATTLKKVDVLRGSRKF